MKKKGEKRERDNDRGEGGAAAREKDKATKDIAEWPVRFIAFERWKEEGRILEKGRRKKRGDDPGSRPYSAICIV